VEDAGGAGWGPERSPALGGSTPEGPGDSVESLETYVRSLRPGASCFCCGGVLKAQRGTGRRLLLVCPSCGSEAERVVGD
jgi:hypothetical protein